MLRMLFLRFVLVLNIDHEPLTTERAVVCHLVHTRHTACAVVIEPYFHFKTTIGDTSYVVCKETHTTRLVQKTSAEISSRE
jgi:hypothetical protein